ncbi:PIN domain-containing protein [Trichothermofontia sichuanensis B231]|uniref:type II toxin-antitoxin system VapC family toxin n=1 Tax=Trichothermofontia sichuanensis TaxID=3045816 RepID=UPI002246D29A|nr:PIN domain-containing protein [Trichothermofontia sichuanensis]UZQ56190.1 PIN domain-containing protein [Trichothermofontia sichuanensis B231]
MAQDAVTQVLSDLNICTVDLEILEQALALDLEDFEDAVQYACAVAYSVDAIVTRDAAGFANSGISVVLPEDVDTINDAG